MKKTMGDMYADLNETYFKQMSKADRKAMLPGLFYYLARTSPTDKVPARVPSEFTT